MDQRILIIDDEKWFWEPFCERLDFELLTYHICKNGTEGLEMLNQNNYSVVILDMLLPLGRSLIHLKGNDVPGILVLKEIRNSKPKLPVICYTCLVGREIEEKIAELKARYISKGSGGDSLWKEIRKYIK